MIKLPNLNKPTQKNPNQPNNSASGAEVIHHQDTDIPQPKQLFPFKMPETISSVLIIIIITFISIISYYSYQNYKLEKQTSRIQPPPVQTSTPTTSPISDWKTYINNNYGFLLSFPQYLTADHDQNQELYYDNLVKMLLGSQYISISAIQNVDIYQGVEPEMVANREVSDSSFAYEIIPQIIANSKAALVKTESEAYIAAFISHPLKENVFIQVSSNLDSDTFNQILSSLQFLPAQSDWKSYKNSKYGFEIKYPDDFFSTESAESSYPPFEFKLKFAENQYQDNESNYPDISVVIIRSPLSPIDFLKENGSTASVVDERKDTGDYLYYGVSHQKHIQVNSLNGLQFESQAVSTGTFHTMFKKGNYIFDVTNRITGVGEISKEIYNQILSTLRFLDETNVTSDLKIYADNTLGITFKYPETWLAEPHALTGYKEILHGLVKLSPSNWKSEVGIAAPVSIYYWDNPERLSPQQFEAKFTAESELGPKVYEPQSTPTTIGGQTSYYSQNGDCEPFPCHKYIIPVYDKIWIIASPYTTNPNEYLPTLNTVINTISFR